MGACGLALSIDGASRASQLHLRAQGRLRAPGCRLKCSDTLSGASHPACRSPQHGALSSTTHQALGAVCKMLALPNLRVALYELGAPAKLAALVEQLVEAAARAHLRLGQIGA